MSVSLNDFQTALKDGEKWVAAEFEIKAQWIAHLYRHHSKILANVATDDNVDLFYIKLWGLLDEFDAPIKTTVTTYRKMNDLNSDLYDKYESHEDKLKAKIKFESFIPHPEQFSKCIDIQENIIQRIEAIKLKFSEEDITNVVRLQNPHRPSNG